MCPILGTKFSCLTADIKQPLRMHPQYGRERISIRNIHPPIQTGAIRGVRETYPSVEGLLATTITPDVVIVPQQTAQATRALSNPREVISAAHPT